MTNSVGFYLKYSWTKIPLYMLTLFSQDITFSPYRHFTSSTNGEMQTFKPWKDPLHNRFNVQLTFTKQNLYGSNTTDSCIFILVFHSIIASVLWIITLVSLPPGANSKCHRIKAIKKILIFLLKSKRHLWVWKNLSKYYLKVSSHLQIFGKIGIRYFIISLNIP